MRILVLTKRLYTGKDLIDDRFGRLRELPLGLADLGHNVAGVCLSYRARREGLTRDANASGAGEVPWSSVNLGSLLIPGLVRYYLEAKRIGRRFQPDLIWACSDAFHALFGVSLAKQLNTKCVVDLYDNFEAFGLTRFPGVLSQFKGAVNSADGVTCVSQALADYVIQNYHRKGPTMVLENAVRKDLFYPQDPKSCRRELGLPENAKIIGTAGALTNQRGIRALFHGFELLAAKDKNLHLAVAGPRDHHSQLPIGPHVHHLGLLPLEQVPRLINALDVAVICNRDSTFGRYCFPQKAYEIIACGTPMVAAAVGPIQNFFAGHPEWLFAPESAQSCAQAIEAQLKQPTALRVHVPSWGDFARRLETFFTNVGTPNPLATSRGTYRVPSAQKPIQS